MNDSHRVGVGSGLPRSVAGCCEHPVVVVGVLAEPLFDAGEGWFDDGPPGQGEGLQRAGHPTVAVPERVDHHEVEVSQRGAYERVEVDVAAQAVRERLHQAGDQFGVGAFVHVGSGLLVLDEDRAGPVAARALVVVVGQHHVVHAADDRGVEAEMGIVAACST